jgi:hypothetical protein
MMEELGVGESLIVKFCAVDVRVGLGLRAGAALKPDEQDADIGW